MHRDQRVMLVFPPTRYTVGVRDKFVDLPLGLAYLAAALRARSIDVACLDATAEGYDRVVEIDAATVEYGLSPDEVVDRAARLDPSVVGISCLFSHQLPAARAIAERVKAALGPRFVVLGGSHPTFLPAQTLASGPFDAIVCGEGEQTLGALVEVVARGGDLGSVEGIVYRLDGDVRITSQRPLVGDLDLLPLPARDLLPVERYIALAFPHSLSTRHVRCQPVLTSRGCPHRCTYCASAPYWRRRFRARRPDAVIGEIATLVERYEIGEVQFADDNLLLDLARAKDLFRLMATAGPRVAWTAPSGLAAWLVDEELVELMRASGCYEVSLAVESGSPAVLRSIHKPIDLARVLDAVRWLHGAGIRVQGFFMLGFPGETRAQVEETLSFIDRAGFDSVAVFMVTPLPGTELHDQAVRSGRLPPGFSFEDVAFYKGSTTLGEVGHEELEGLLRRTMWRGWLRLLVTRPVRFYGKFRNFLVARVKDRLRGALERIAGGQ